MAATKRQEPGAGRTIRFEIDPANLGLAADPADEEEIFRFARGVVTPFVRWGYVAALAGAVVVTAVRRAKRARGR
jgi:hypothetical protein